MAVVQKCISGNDLGKAAMTVNTGSLPFQFRDHADAKEPTSLSEIDNKYDNRFIYPSGA